MVYKTSPDITRYLFEKMALKLRRALLAISVGPKPLAKESRW